MKAGAGDLRVVDARGRPPRVVLWQDSQLLLVVICVAFLPVACVPLWQLTQLPVTPLWLNVAGRQAVLVWQVSQLLLEVMCVAFLPVA